MSHRSKTQHGAPANALCGSGEQLHKRRMKKKINCGFYSDDLPSFHEATRPLLKLEGRCNFIKSFPFSAASATNKVLCQTWIHCMCRCKDVTFGFRSNFGSLQGITLGTFFKPADNLQCCLVSCLLASVRVTSSMLRAFFILGTAADEMVISANLVC